MKKKDFILIFAVLLVIATTFGINYFFNTKRGENIEIYVDNKLYKTYSIDDDEEIKIKITEEITEASCTDKVCVNSGFITKPSESIVCLPNKIHIKITTHDNNKNENEEDVISN